MDFDGWQYYLAQFHCDPRALDRTKPLVYFGSFQDLLGRDDSGNIKTKNEWLHMVKWDLVVFDEYHFGAWRDTATELFEGEEDAVAKKETNLEYTAGLEHVNEDLSELSAKESRIPAHHHQGVPLPSPARRSRHWQRANSLKNRSSTGRTPTNSAQRTNSRPTTRIAGTRMAHCRRCACSPTRCQMSY